MTQNAAMKGDKIYEIAVADYATSMDALLTGRQAVPLSGWRCLATARRRCETASRYATSLDASSSLASKDYARVNERQIWTASLATRRFTPKPVRRYRTGDHSP
jgi:hypothetical protein